MAICDNGYYNKVTYLCGERNTVKRNYHPFKVAHDFLLEGANVVLLRYLGLRRYKGTIKTDTVLINGTICESVYVRYTSAIMFHNLVLSTYLCNTLTYDG